MDDSFKPYRKAASYLLQRLQDAEMELPQLGIVCGSGLSGLGESLDGPTLRIQYGDIPGFPVHCTVAGHRGEVVFGRISGVRIICFRGRFHSYEGHDMKVVVLPISVMRCLSVKVVIVTNAAGGLNERYDVGSVVCISDHLAIPQLAGKNPLIGPNDDELGPRFPATSNAYPNSLRKCAFKAAQELKYKFVIPHGTYCFVSGPMYESRAECRFLRSLGGDAVGMSTVPEVVTAHHCNMQVLCLSLITNKVVMAGDEDETDHGPVANHQEVLKAVESRAKDVQDLVKKTVEIIGKEIMPGLPDLPLVSLDTPAFGQDFFRSDKHGKNGLGKQLILGAMILAGGALIGMAASRKR